MADLFCRVGLHKWADCAQAVSRLEFATLSLELRACKRCKKLHSTSADQLRGLLPYWPGTPAIEYDTGATHES